jgi:aquaporin Z
MLVAIYEFLGTMLLTFSVIISGGNLIAISLTFFCIL